MKLRRIVVLIVLTAFSAGCNTASGFGRDLEKLGDKISKKAEEKKRY
jgi:predicted small secreted protein